VTELSTSPPPPSEPPVADLPAPAVAVVTPEPVSPRTVFRWSVAAGLGLLVVSLGTLIVYNVRDLLVQIAVAAFIALSLDPAVRWLIRHKVRRSYAVAIIFVLFLALIGGLMWLAVRQRAVFVVASASAASFFCRLT